MKSLLESSYAATLVGLLGLAAALAWVPARADEDSDRAKAVRDATQVAQHWLEALDSGDYAASWKGISAVMKEGREEADWIKDVAAPRATLGKPIIREMKEARFETTLRGAPQGKYVIATYLSQYAKAAPSMETVLLRMEDEQWQVAGYNVGPAPADSSPSAPADKPGAATGAKPGG